MDEKITFAAFATVLLVFIAHPVAKAADASASTAFSTAGRVEFSQGGRLTVGNDILALSAPDFGRQIENTDVPMSVELYALGQRAAAPGDSAFLQSRRRFARMGAAKGKRP